jgi:ParB family chromosome partitioning protein
MEAKVDHIRLDRLNLPEPPTRTRRSGLDRLATSVKEVGLLVPLLVRSLGRGEYAVIGGVGRLEALRAGGAGAHTLVPCLVVDVEDPEAALLALTDNLVREPMSAFDQARQVKLIRDEYGLTQKRIAAALGVDEAALSRHVAVFDLVEEVIRALGDGKISMSAAFELVPLKSDPDGQRTVLARILAQGLGTSEVAAVVAERRHQGAVARKRFAVDGKARARVQIRTARNGEIVIDVRARSRVGLGSVFEQVMKELKAP